MVGLYSSGYIGSWTNSRSRSYYGSNGGKYQGQTHITNYGSTFTAGDIIGVAFDATNNSIEFFKNGTSQGVAFSGNDADNSMGIQLSTGYYGETATLLLNSSDWNYSAPTGFGQWTGAITAYNNQNFSTSGASFSSTTQNHDGTDTGITYATTNYGVADFDASSDKIVFDSSLASRIRTAQAFSIGLWFWCDGLTSTDQQIFHMLNNTYLLIRIDGGTDYIEAYWGNGNNGTFYQLKTPNNFVKERTWYNVIVTANATEDARLFVNGSLQDTISGWDGTFMTYTNSNYAFNMLGQQGSNVHPFNGKIGECQVYNAALTPEQALQNYNATKHKYAYGLNGFHLPLNNTSTGTIVNDSNLKLHLDASDSSSYGGSGTTWSDLTTNNNDGTISGAGFLSSTNGGVFDFDGNDKIEITTIKDDIDNNQPFTLECWFFC